MNVYIVTVEIEVPVYAEDEAAAVGLAEKHAVDEYGAGEARFRARELERGRHGWWAKAIPYGAPGDKTVEDLLPAGAPEKTGEGG